MDSIVVREAATQALVLTYVDTLEIVDVVPPTPENSAKRLTSWPQSRRNCLSFLAPATLISLTG